MTVYERAERYLSSCDGAISNGYPRFLRELLCNCPQAGFWAAACEQVMTNPEATS